MCWSPEDVSQIASRVHKLYPYTPRLLPTCHLIHISSDPLTKGMFMIKPRPTVLSAWWRGEDGVIRTILVNRVWREQ